MQAIAIHSKVLYIAWSVCAADIGEPCKNRQTDQDAIWGQTDMAQEPCIKRDTYGIKTEPQCLEAMQHCTTCHYQLIY